jgi:hypothetical protein
VKFAAGPAEKLVGLEEKVNAEEVVFTEAPTAPAGDVDERVNDEEDERLYSMVGKLGTRAQPVAKQILVPEVLLCLVYRSWEGFLEQVLGVLPWVGRATVWERTGAATARTTPRRRSARRLSDLGSVVGPLREATLDLPDRIETIGHRSFHVGAHNHHHHVGR